LREYPAASRAIEARLQDFRVDVRQIPGARSKQPAESLALFRSKGFRKVEARLPSAYERIVCEGNEAFFDLMKRDGELGFRVTSIGGVDSDLAKFDQKYGRLFHVPLGSGFGRLAELMNDPTFELLTATDVDQGTGKVKIEFQVGPEPPSKGSFVLDPSNQWAVVAERRELGDKPRFEVGMNVDYGDRVDGFAYPKRVEFLLPGPPGNVAAFEYRDWKFEPTPIDAFRMSHYGIADLNENRVPTNSNRLRFALLACVAALLVAGCLLWKWSTVSKSSPIH
jgi:hypothetical protein